MALTTPTTASDIIDRVVNDVFLTMQSFGAKPALRNSWINAFIVGYSNRVFDFYFALDQAALEALPDTAVDNIERWAAIWGIVRLAGSVSTGQMTIAATSGTVIPKGTVFSSGDGLQFVNVEDDTAIIQGPGVDTPRS
jgi:uncharacterized phage protein gp47/JayE